MSQNLKRSRDPEHILRRYAIMIAIVLVIVNVHTKFDLLSFTHSEDTSGPRNLTSIADEPARFTASRQTCCKQRWTLSVLNVRPN